MNQFTQKAFEYVKAEAITYDLVHAHDWLTFNAARRIADHLDIPWIAHFHSVEADRREEPAPWIAYVEDRACRDAQALVVPSDTTRRRVLELYQADPKKVKDL